ncbi:hypothetical protein MTBBW1_350061 [Desulfamplus magnetovallimortis]|uniref:Uncharacterized protein n=1 Tax=Desulfamplus magnetovallimortis TaxID=1246637 RepID=A0A1W1HGI3_9BACT|nr:hypothetical protein MTBBW1_350061 [Desulfamplus magnetovallimortis]
MSILSNKIKTSFISTQKMLKSISLICRFTLSGKGYYAKTAVVCWLKITD